MILAMAQASSPPAKKPPTIPSSGSAKRATIAGAPEAAPAEPGRQAAWPAGLPPINIALKIVRGYVEPPAELREPTAGFMSSLTFAESAALHDLNPTGDAETLCSIVASRWRLMSALELRPEGNVTPDAMALEELLTEIDGTLARLRTLAQNEDPDIREACDSAKAALAKDVQRLLPTSTGAGPATYSPTDDLNQLRTALAAATKSERQATKARSSVARSKKTMAIMAAGIISMASGTYTMVKAFHYDQPPPVPELPQPPADTEVLGNPGSGTVIVRSTNGKPIDREALEKFKARAGDSGASVQMLGPTQALVTSSSSPKRH
jgi:hypothetical protein